MSETSRPSASRQREIRLATGSRLHFGLLDTVEPFGGVGVMIHCPLTEVLVTPAASFEYVGPESSRALAIAKRVLRFAPPEDACRLGELPPCRIEVPRFAPSHHGLGSGTQLSMTVAEGICRFLQISVDEMTLATKIASRGKRSAIGIHGYFHGGMIYEALSPSGQLNEIQQRVELPSGWAVAILRPAFHGEVVHGAAEAESFARIAAASPAEKIKLQHIACEQLLPSAAAGDFQNFAAAIELYNRSSGMLFAAIQGGPYNGTKVESLIEWLAGEGVRGVGQSSWGPSVFAWFESRDHAESLVSRVPPEFELITLATTKNVGRSVQELG
jgi:beta-RFAP synthase